MRHFYSALFPLAPPKEEGIDLLFCGAHTTQADFPFVVSSFVSEIGCGAPSGFHEPQTNQELPMT